MEKIYVNGIEVIIENTYEEMSRQAADLLCEELKHNPNGVYGFATGSTPEGLYQELIKRYESKLVDFSGITTVNLDEYYPISKENEQSYDYFMKEKLFNHLNIKPANINIPNGEAPDASAECLRYESKITECGGIDFQILGIGKNGHIGFNEPSDSISEITQCVDLTESTIDANSRFFASSEEVPKKAITMGIKTILKAKKILLLANSKNKSDILYQALMGSITPLVPASLLRLHNNVTVVTDKEAAEMLLVKKNN